MLSGNFAEMTTSTPFRNLLHLRHGTDGFTSAPKEGVLRIFSSLKIRRLRPGLNQRTWVLKASTLPLDHRSPFTYKFRRKSSNTKFHQSPCSGSRVFPYRRTWRSYCSLSAIWRTPAIKLHTVTRHAVTSSVCDVKFCTCFVRKYHLHRNPKPTWEYPHTNHRSPG